jgi:hypothetical protein
MHPIGLSKLRQRWGNRPTGPRAGADPSYLAFSKNTILLRRPPLELVNYPRVYYCLRGGCWLETYDPWSPNQSSTALPCLISSES